MHNGIFILWRKYPFQYKRLSVSLKHTRLTALLLYRVPRIPYCCGTTMERFTRVFIDRTNTLASKKIIYEEYSCKSVTNRFLQYYISKNFDKIHSSRKRV